MSVERELWNGYFVDKEPPHFVCPQCRKGRLAIIKDTMTLEEPAFSKRARSNPDWEFDWIVKRFSLRLQCGLPNCREVVFIAGEGGIEELEHEERGWVQEVVLSPRVLAELVGNRSKSIAKLVKKMNAKKGKY